MSIVATPDTMAWAREHIPESVLTGMLKDGFLKEIKEFDEVMKNDD